MCSKATRRADIAAASALICGWEVGPTSDRWVSIAAHTDSQARAIGNRQPGTGQDRPDQDPGGRYFTLIAAA
jgi:hypothetical protein